MKNENRATHPRKEHAQARSGRCIALIDSNYMAWLLKQSTDTDTDAEPEAYNRLALIPTLVQTLKQAGLGLDVQRVYWYTDNPTASFLPTKSCGCSMSPAASPARSLSAPCLLTSPVCQSAKLANTC